MQRLKLLLFLSSSLNRSFFSWLVILAKFNPSERQCPRARYQFAVSRKTRNRTIDVFKCSVSRYQLVRYYLHVWDKVETTFICIWLTLYEWNGIKLVQSQSWYSIFTTCSRIANRLSRNNTQKEWHKRNWPKHVDVEMVFGLLTEQTKLKWTDVCFSQHPYEVWAPSDSSLLLYTKATLQPDQQVKIFIYFRWRRKRERYPWLIWLVHIFE